MKMNHQIISKSKVDAVLGVSVRFLFGVFVRI